MEKFAVQSRHYMGRKEQFLDSLYWPPNDTPPMLAEKEEKEEKVKEEEEKEYNSEEEVRKDIEPDKPWPRK